jgi:hypothetical protein
VYIFDTYKILFLIKRLCSPRTTEEELECLTSEEDEAVQEQLMEGAAPSGSDQKR